MIEHTPVVAALETGNRRVRIARLLWRFPTVLELKPLPLEACETIATAWLAHNPIRFSDPRTRTRFIHHLAQHSGGIPAAIQGMLEAAAAPGEITPASAASLAHGAGVRHLDMTPLVVIGLVLAMAGRYISRGVGEVEMRVLSGVATALFMGLRVVLWQMRGR